MVSHPSKVASFSTSTGRKSNRITFVPQVCDVPQCPTDGPWARDFEADAASGAIKCTDAEGNPAKDCDCSCVGVKGKAKVELLQTGEKRICHC